MRILITNNRLNFRGGAESFVRDLARGLQDLGHSVLAFSSDPGLRERLLENDVVPVATDLEHLPFKPDVIHGQHHLDAMTALMALPGVPAVYHCHGAVWRNCAPKHPRIHRYLAMSQTLAQRMEVESNIPAADITVLLNGVDLARFSTVRKLPEQPARVLFYNGHHANDSATTSAVREAASRCRLDLDFIGRQFGRMIPEPERVMPGYDIVFASGISAVEALACGCAVVVLGRTSCGAMVTTGNLDRFRQVNFSIPVNAPPPSVEKIEAEIRRFSAPDAALVSERLRREADFGRSVRVLVDLYEKVIAKNARSKPRLPAEILAASRYLRKIVPAVKIMDDIWNFSQMSATMADSIDQLGERFTEFEEQLGARFPGSQQPK